MFGSRDRMGWRRMEVERARLDKQITREQNQQVAIAMKQVRADIVLNALPSVQRKLLDALMAAEPVGGPELMDILFRRSGCVISDLLDILGICNQLGAEGMPGAERYERFVKSLVAVLKLKKGPALDHEITDCLGESFDDVEFFLLKLLSDPMIIKRRLDQYLAREGGRGADQRFLLRTGIERIFELGAKVGSMEAEMYLRALAKPGEIIREVIPPLMARTRNTKLLNEVARVFLREINQPESYASYAGGLDSIGGRMVWAMTTWGRKRVVNMDNPLIYNERLLALSLLSNVGNVKEGAILELMLESGERWLPEREKRDPEHFQRRQEIRTQILEDGILGETGFKLGLRKILTPLDWSISKMVVREDGMEG